MKEPPGHESNGEQNKRQIKGIGVLGMILSLSIGTMTSSPCVRFNVRAGSGAASTAASTTVGLTVTTGPTVAATCNAAITTYPAPIGRSLGPFDRSSCILCCSASSYILGSESLQQERKSFHTLDY